MSLRNRTLTQINNALEQSGFYKLADFDISAKDGGKQTDLRIEYKYNPEFMFLAAIPHEKQPTGVFGIGLRYTPGEVNVTETGNTQNLDGLTVAISNWTNRIKGETLSSPEMRVMQEQRRLIAELAGSLSQVPNEYFSQEEAKEIRTRLDAFEEKLAKNLAEHTNDKAALAEKVKALTADVEMLRENISYLSKQNWATALVVRAFSWLKDPANQKLLKSGADVVHTLLEDGHKPH